MSAHPYLKLRLPPNSPFELRPSPGKGWGVFAIKNITRGDLILTETPLFVIDASSPKTAYGDIAKGFQALSPAQKQQFICIRDNGNENFKNVIEAFEQNSLQPKNSSRRSLYPLQSRFNHSCIPNARSPIESRDIHELIAAKDISVGKEITFSYSPSDFRAMSRDERQQWLCHTCDCKACTLGTPFQTLSEMRRRLLRGLLYLMEGVDLDGKQDNSMTPLICEPQLKFLVEENNLPLSCSFVFLILSICLSEAEGILDDGDVEMQEKELRHITATFRTSKNFKVAELAMQQPTWPGGFWVALGVWKEYDRVDPFISGARMVNVLFGLPRARDIF